MHSRFLYLFLLLWFPPLLPAAEAQPVKQDEKTATQTAAVHTFKRFYIADTEEKAVAMKPEVAADGIVVMDVPLLATEEFRKVMTPFLGQSITNENVQKIGSAIQEYARKHDRLVTKVMIPTQDISSGALRMAVLFGHYRDLKFTGNRWFSTRLLIEKLGIKPGDEVRLSSLEDGLNWANANPFRHIKVLVNEQNVEPGKADLIVAVQERLPLRLTAGYCNYGTAVTGDSRYNATIQYGNLWGSDHQITYAYTTTDRQENFTAHYADYKIPLPWHHYIIMSGVYAKIAPIIDSYLSQKGETILANIRYVAPKEIGRISTELSGGLDYKQSNNNLYFGGTNYWGSKVDVAQITLSATASRPDSIGAWAVGVTANISPGNFNNRNTDEQFNKSRPGSAAEYLYGTLFIQRSVKLPGGFTSATNFMYQRASTNLTGNEQMVVGGHSTVRGYREALYAGDEGITAGEELYGPAWSKALPFISKNAPALQLVPLAFFDYAHTWYKFQRTTDFPLQALMSTGIGIRCSAGPNFSLSADYGWQLAKTSFRRQQEGARGSIRVSMSY